jgi:L-malate glycosyltransferase
LPNILGTAAGVFGFVPARVASQHTPAACYRRWLRWLDRVLGSSFVYTRNIVVSRTLAGTFDDYPAAYRTKISVVYNSVPEPRNVLGQREARQRCSLPLDGILIGNVGRLVPQKNQKFLLELIADLPQVHLAIAGAGELRDELVEVARRLKVTDRLHLAGPLPWEGVHSFLSSLDLFIFPSQFEGFGIALFEALQVGVPVLANDLPVLREVLIPAPGLIGGVLAPVSDRQAWLREIASLTADQSRRSALIEAGRRVADFYSLETMIDGYESAIMRSFARGVALS